MLDLWDFIEVDVEVIFGFWWWSEGDGGIFGFDNSIFSCNVDVELIYPFGKTNICSKM